jgi:CxxC motif-containing protein
MAYTNKETAITKLKERANFSSKNFDNFRDNKEVVLVALDNEKSQYNSQYQPPVYWNISHRLKTDREVALKTVENCGNLYYSVREHFPLDKEIILTAIKGNSDSFDYIPNEYKNDRDFTIKAIKINPRILKYIPDSFVEDKEIVLSSITGLAEEKFQVEGIYLYIGKTLLSNKEFGNEATKLDGRILRFLSDELKNDKEIISLATDSYIYAIEYASEELRNNKEIMLRVVKQDGRLLKYASDELKNDKEVVSEALDTHCLALEYASEIIRNDKEVVLSTVSCVGAVLEYASDELKNNKEIVLAAVKNAPYSIKYASPQIKSLCNDNDPVKVLESAILTEKLHKSMNLKQEQKPARKLKI